jgi:chromate reductase
MGSFSRGFGSLRKGSFNRALMNALPALAPADMKLIEAPSFRGFPLYDADLQAKGFPPDVTALADAIRAADAVIIITRSQTTPFWKAPC